MQAALWVVFAGAIVLFVWSLRKFWWPFGKVGYIVSRHVGTAASSLSTLSKPFATIDLPNIELALRELAPNGRRFGIAGGGFIPFRSEDLGAILTGNARIAGVQTESVEVGVSETMACMVNGLVLVDEPGRAVVYVYKEEMLQKLEVQVGASDPMLAETILARISNACGRDSVYKGRIISLTQEHVARSTSACVALRFHPPAGISATDVILPPASAPPT